MTGPLARWERRVQALRALDVERLPAELETALNDGYAQVKDQGARARRAPAHLPDALDARLPRQVEVHHHDVGRQPGDAGDRRLDVGGVGHVADAVLGQQAAQPVAEQVVVVHEQDAEAVAVEAGRGGVRLDHVEGRPEPILQSPPTRDEVVNRFARRFRSRRRRRELERANEDLRRANRDLEEFAYMAAHDLQAPLSMAAGFTALVRDRHGDGLEPEAREFLGYVAEGIADMQELIGGMLQLARGGPEGLERTRVDTGALVADLVAGMRQELDRRGAEVRVGELPVMDADPQRLRQVFANLLSNAVKFSEGTPHIEVGAGRERGGWRFEVRDGGIGVPAAHAGAS
jgi:signal transduction histidine kinase